jgi:hypothetical protein
VRGVRVPQIVKSILGQGGALDMLGARKPNVSGESSISLNDAIAAGSF